MGWQQLSYGVWFTNLGPLAPNWWRGWSSAGGFRLFRSDAAVAVTGIESSTAEPPVPIPLHCQEQEGWVDYFLGEAGSDPKHRCSVIDAKHKQALHYLKADLPHLYRLDCPYPEIPSYLWQKLMARAMEWSISSSRIV